MAKRARVSKNSLIFRSLPGRLAQGFSVGVLFILAVTFLAEAESDRGRLADGRAFRTDAEGNQLVDYIAELELSVDELQQRVRGLENELERRTHQLSRLESGDTSSQGLIERDLMNGSKGSAQPDDVASSGNIARVEPRFSTPTVLPEHERELELLKTRLSLAEKEYHEARKGCEQKVLALKKVLSEKGQEEAKLFAELKEAKENIVKVSTLPVARQVTEDSGTRSSLKPDFAAAEPVSVSASKSEPVVKTVSRKDSSLNDMNARLLAAKQKAHEEEQARRRAELEALKSVKSSLQTELNKLHATVITRNRLFEEYNKKGAPLKLTPTAIVSERGNSLKTLREGLNTVSSPKRLSSIRSEIREMNSLVQKDIALVRRLKK